jgi:TetR/AcrR family transcriptional regulator, transcriptional repressor for nem operon
MIVILQWSKLQHMRYKEDHKQLSRERIVDAAATLFKEDGINAVGIAAIMKSAQLTNGAFYAHFESKQALIEVVIASELDSQLHTFQGAPHDSAGLKLIIDTYLSTDHRNSCADGCLSAALIGDITKLHDKAKTIYAAGLNDVTDQIRMRAPSSQTNNAYGIFGLLIGTLQLARGVSDPVESEKILASGRQAALQLAGL